METLEIGELRLIAGFHQSFKSFFNQFDGSAAENHLFSKKISFRFFFEGRLKNTSPRGADALAKSQRAVGGMARHILFDGEKSGRASAFFIGSSHQMSRAFRDRKSV